VGAGALRIQCPLSGQCPSGSSYLDDTIEIPTGFNVEIESMGNPMLVTLSQDSRTIQINNLLFPSCSETATRNGASLSTGTLNLAFVFLLSGLMAFKQLIL
jgi:hypothetical protein